MSESKTKAKWLKDKFHKLKQEGFKGDQLVAVALSYAKKKEKKDGK